MVGHGPQKTQLQVEFRKAILGNLFGERFGDIFGEPLPNMELI